MEHSALMSSLGIIPSINIAKSGVPDYLVIALGWYARYDRTGENFALQNYHHYIGVAQEFNMCYVEEPITIW